MTQFKKGDRVVCVEPSRSRGLEPGRVYVVEWGPDWAGDILIEGLDYYFSAQRFVLAQRPDPFTVSAGVDRYGWVRS